MVNEFARVLAKRLGRFALDRILTAVQGWCLDQCLVLRGVCEVWKREEKNSYLAFQDISKAYDTVWWREGLWHKMRQ